MSSPTLVTAADISLQALTDFLRQVYPPLKSSFLLEHGAWWHKADTNRLIILVDDQVAGYCGIIPVRVWVNGEARSALWWVDLVIAEKFRGRGLQSLFDERVREMSDLLLGFPNEVAAKIHRKHGWGVREDIPILMLPLWPTQVKMVRSAQGRQGWIRRAGALALSPLAALWRAWLLHQSAHNAWKMENFNAQTLADVFQRTSHKELNTALRDADYFTWRYRQAPRPSEYTFYLAGPREAPTHFLIARYVIPPEGSRYARILDVFGDFRDTAALRDMLTMALHDCVRHGAGQVTLFATRPELYSLARHLGFIFSAPVGFCWLCNDAALMQSLSRENYWVLADSDNDAPD